MKHAKMIFFMRVDDVDISKEIYFNKINILGTTVLIPDDRSCREQLNYFLNSIDLNNFKGTRETICIDDEYKIFFDLKYSIGRKQTRIEIGVTQQGAHTIKKVQVVKLRNDEAYDKIRTSLIYKI